MTTPNETTPPRPTDSAQQERGSGLDTPTCSAFVVIAYRYGMRDAHSYLVAVCDNLEDAQDAAEKEVSYRGGKYGCEVVECPRQRWHEKLTPRQVAYVPSPYEGAIGEGCDQADRTTEGWKDRMAENLRSRMPRFDPPNDQC